MEIKRRDLAGALSLSCVENYFLAWLKDYDLKKLYGAAFVGVKEVLEGFIHGALYQNYRGIPRLQDVAEEYGLTEHDYRVCGAGEAMKIIREQKEHELCLIRVNPQFFVGFKRSSWREDHYVCVDRALNWVNQYPLSEGVFDEETFAKVYDGAVNVYRTLDPEAELPKIIEQEFVEQDFHGIELPQGLPEMEGAIGVLRVTRKRMEECFTGNSGIKEILQEENHMLDKIYLDTYRLRLKQRSGTGAGYSEEKQRLRERLKEIIELERRAAGGDGK